MYHDSCNDMVETVLDLPLFFGFVWRAADNLSGGTGLSMLIADVQTTDSLMGESSMEVVVVVKPGWFCAKEFINAGGCGASAPVRIATGLPFNPGIYQTLSNHTTHSTSTAMSNLHNNTWLTWRRMQYEHIEHAWFEDKNFGEMSRRNQGGRCGAALEGVNFGFDTGNTALSTSHVSHLAH